MLSPCCRRSVDHFSNLEKLSGLFADELQTEDHGRVRRAWYATEEPEWSTWDENWVEEDWTWHEEGEEDAYWSWPTPPWGDGAFYDDFYPENEEEMDTYYQDTGEKTTDEIEGEKRIEEAYAIAAEANRTLAEAKEAVAKVRAARGYYDPSGMKGSAPRDKGKGSGSAKGKKSGKGAFGPCFHCGRPGHSYLQCPDRWSPGKGKPSAGSPKAKGKGKGKKSGKGKKTFFTECYPNTVYMLSCSTNYLPDINVLSLEGADNEFYRMAPQKVLLDTGATESVAGVAAMQRLIEANQFTYSIILDQRPQFKFGNGASQRAVSKIHIYSPAIGEISFYLLDAGADYTPPLLGARDLRQRQALISYQGDWLAHREGATWWVTPLESTGGGHLALDLSSWQAGVDEQDDQPGVQEAIQRVATT